MVFILEYYPYNKADGVTHLIGPFPTTIEARAWRAKILAAGAHPDSDWEIITSETPEERVKAAGDEFEGALDP